MPRARATGEVAGTALISVREMIQIGLAALEQQIQDRAGKAIPAAHPDRSMSPGRISIRYATGAVFGLDHARDTWTISLQLFQLQAFTFIFFEPGDVRLFSSPIVDREPNPLGHRLDAFQHFQTALDHLRRLVDIGARALPAANHALGLEVRMASRKVARETPSCSARSGSEGSRSPGFVAAII